MLHRIYPPDCVPQLQAIRQFQRDVLALACSPQIQLPLSQQTLQAQLGNQRGSWLWYKLWKQPGYQEENKRHRQLVALIEYTQQHPTTRQLVLDAFDNDTAFHTALDDARFQFHYLRLNNPTQNVIKPLMIAFYEDLLSSEAGFDTSIHQQSQKLNRDAFISSFWRANAKLEVCPACDDKRPDKIKDKHYDDADHYFPKSVYPFLSVHHANLVPTCSVCNSRIKSTRDPIDDHQNAPLLNAFHPYGLPAIEHVDIQITRNSEGVEQILIKDRKGMPSRRVESLKRIFRLHERWLDRLRYQMEVVRDQVANAGRRLQEQLQKSGHPLDEQVLAEEFEYVLEEMLEDTRHKIGQRHGYVLKTSYLWFALQDPDEFELLFIDFVG